MTGTTNTADFPAIDAPIIDAARWLVHQRGFSVIALDHPAMTRHTDPKKIGKVPVASWGAFQETRPAEDTLLAWFGNGTLRNIGIVTGAVSNIIVIDGDSVEALDWMRANLPPTEMRTKTAKGEHWFYRHPGSANVRNTTRLQTGHRRLSLDVRADGGYVVAPGSQHASGLTYTRLGTWPTVDQLPIFDQAWLDPVQPAIPDSPQSKAEVGIRQHVRNYLDKIPPAIEGQGGDERTFQVCARVVRGFDLSDADALDLLSTWNQKCVPPWTERDLLAKIQNARRYGDEPFGGRRGPGMTGTEISTVSTGATASATGTAFNATDSSNAPHFSDTGNAARFVRLHRDRLLYCYPMGTWLVYDGRVWRPDTTGEAMRLAKATVATIYQEAARAEDDKQRKALAGWALQSENERRLTAMISLARPELHVSPEQLDADPWSLNVLNGTLDLRSGELRTHRASDLLTKLAPVRYDPAARSELFERVLEHALPDPSVRRFAQKLAGYTLTGATGEDVLVSIFGPTRTSKGTFQEALAATLGDYALTAELDLLAQRDRSGGPRPELVRLRGARMVSIYETSSRMTLSASLVKTLSGNDPITARDNYEKPITFHPQLKLWLATNYRPKAPADDDALWARIRELPFRVVVPESERDPAVRAALRDPCVSGAAVLAWAMQGCLFWQSEGLAQPDAVRAATLDYRAEMDPLRGFVADCCALQPGAWTPSEKLRAEYERWAHENAERAVDGTQFRNGLRRHGAEPERRHSGRGWRGIGLLTSESVTP